MDNRQKGNQSYTYKTSGFNAFLRRSIDNVSSMTLWQAANDFRRVNNQQTNFDQQQNSGSLGDIIRVGNIYIDGKNGRISVFEGNNEVVRIGQLDG